MELMRAIYINIKINIYELIRQVVTCNYFPQLMLMFQSMHNATMASLTKHFRKIPSASHLGLVRFCILKLVKIEDTVLGGGILEVVLGVKHLRTTSIQP